MMMEEVGPCGRSDSGWYLWSSLTGEEDWVFLSGASPRGSP